MIVGAVLCGGRSTRMGTDKALLVLDGVAMARRVADALIAAGCHQVVAIGGDRTGLEAIGLPVVEDGWPDEGPVGGVLTALRAVPGADAVVVVACDLPRLQAASIDALLRALSASPIASVAVARTDRLEPLCAAWRHSAELHLAAALAGDERRLHAVIGSLAAVEVTLDATDLTNVNAPGDLGSSL